MKEIFKINLITEPDFQRLNNFIIKALLDFNVNILEIAAKVTVISEKIRHDFNNSNSIFEVALLFKMDTFHVQWQGKSISLPKPKTSPDITKINALAESMKEQIVNTSPELLKLQNLKIKDYLSSAKKKAEDEIKKVEKQLALRKQELEEYIIKAETDSLTGLLNRRAYNTHLNEALRQLRTKKNDFCLLYLDLDHFKAINDTYGHNFGDTVLKNMSANILNNIRQNTDFGFRIGGDEFVVILFSGENTAIRVAKKILSDITQGVSIGFTLADKDDTPGIITKRADMALYLAKEMGRKAIAVAKRSKSTNDPSAASLEIVFNGKN